MMVWLADDDGETIFVNRKWQAFTGNSRRAASEKNRLVSVHPDDRQTYLSEYQTALRRKGPFAREYRLRRADGLYRWMRDLALPLHEDNGAFAGHVGACIDITDRREGTATPDRTVEHLRLVAVHADEMIYRRRLGAADVEYVSPGVSRITGLAPNEFAAAPDSVLERIHPDDRQRLQELLLSPPDHQRSVTLRWQRDDGGVTWAEHRWLPVYDRDGNLVAVDGVARDVTRQKELDLERKAQIKLLNGLISHMSDGVIAEDDGGDLAVVNGAFRRMFDLPEGNVSGWRTVVGDLVLQPPSCRLTSGEDGAGSTELRLSDGRVLDCESFSIRLEDDRLIHMWEFRDITVRKREEEELRASRHRIRDLSAHLEAAREEERRGLARMLHDEVGQLLTGIRLEIDAAVQEFRRTRSREDFAVVDRLQAAAGLVDVSLTTVQRIATALRPPILDHLGLVAALRWEAAIFERRTGIRCRVQASPAVIETREHITVLYRILLEALTNVARHAHAGTVWIQVRQSDRRLTMEVRDNGRGIDDEAIANPTTLGLLGMRERALAVGGELRVKRRQTGGTSIAASVPIVASVAAPDTPADA